MALKRSSAFVFPGLSVLATGAAVADEPAASVDGYFVANGQKVEPPFVYVYAEKHGFYDNTFQYDFTFGNPLSDPFAPIGDGLPAGGGEPGAAFVGFCDAVHAGDKARLKTLMPAEQVEMLAGEDEDQIKEDLEFMKMVTPTDIEVLGGSSDGETAILNVKGTTDGQQVTGEITMAFTDGRWVTTDAAWE